MKWPFYVIYSEACLVYSGSKIEDRTKKSFPLCLMRKARDFVFYKPQVEPRFTRHFKGLWDIVWVDQGNVIMSLYSSASKEVESRLTF